MILLDSSFQHYPVNLLNAPRSPIRVCVSYCCVYRFNPTVRQWTAKSYSVRSRGRIINAAKPYDFIGSVGPVLTSPKDSPTEDLHWGASKDRHYSGYASGADNGMDFIPRSIKGYD